MSFVCQALLVIDRDVPEAGTMYRKKTNVGLEM